MTTSQMPDHNTYDVTGFSGEWAVEADGELLVLVRDNGHTAEGIAKAALLNSDVRDAIARGAEVTIRALSTEEFQASCEHTFMFSDDTCWRCGAIL